MQDVLWLLCTAQIPDYKHVLRATQHLHRTSLSVVAIPGCQLDYIWNERQSRNGGHTCGRFSAWFEVGEPAASPDV